MDETLFLGVPSLPEVMKNTDIDKYGQASTKQFYEYNGEIYILFSY